MFGQSQIEYDYLLTFTYTLFFTMAAFVSNLTSWHNDGYTLNLTTQQTRGRSGFQMSCSKDIV
jgi:hypothetical protein